MSITKEEKMIAKKYILIVVVMVLVLAGAIPAAAEAPREDFTVIAKQTQALNPGVWNIHDGHLHVAGMVSVYEACWTFIDISQTACHQEIVTVNFVVSLLDMTGPMWGSFEYRDENGYLTWEGTWVGSRSLVNGDVISTIHDIGRGAGPNEGLLFQYTIQAVNASPENPVPFSGTGFVQTTGNYNH